MEAEAVEALQALVDSEPEKLTRRVEVANGKKYLRGQPEQAKPAAAAKPAPEAEAASEDDDEAEAREEADAEACEIHRQLHRELPPGLTIDDHVKGKRPPKKMPPGWGPGEEHEAEGKAFLEQAKAYAESQGLVQLGAVQERSPPPFS